MADKVIDPIGIYYKQRQGSYEYQLFPEEYFSGADVHIYFGDTWNEELTGLTFMLAEQVKPIFGYASYTWDYVARGARMAQGEFSIAFKSAAYLYDIMEHLGRLDGKQAPKLAYDLYGQSAPSWLKDSKGKINDILSGYPAYQNELGMAMPSRAKGGGNANIEEDLVASIWGRQFAPTIDNTKMRNPYWNAGKDSKNLDQRGFDIHIVYGPLADYALNNQVAQKDVPFNSTIQVVRRVQLTGVKQVIDPSGKAIEEVYSFISRDIN